jgi:hypothetical protein
MAYADRVSRPDWAATPPLVLFLLHRALNAEPNIMTKLVLVVGVISVLLGGLWLLQGLDLVHVRPILCFADCVPLQGPSPTWAIIGFFVVTAGVIAILYSLKRRTHP